MASPKYRGKPRAAESCEWQVYIRQADRHVHIQTNAHRCIYATVGGVGGTSSCSTHMKRRCADAHSYTCTYTLCKCIHCCANVIDVPKNVTCTRVFRLLQLETTAFAETPYKLLLENFASYRTGIRNPAPLPSYIANICRICMMRQFCPSTTYTRANAYLN